MSTVSIIICSVIIAIPLALSVIPMIIGAVKKSNVIKPVEYVPPRGASPIDIMIRYYGASAEPHEIFNPLMLHWAARGFITIEEDCKRGLKLTKIKDLQVPEEIDGYNAETFEIERELFDCLFGGSKKVFYTLTARFTFKEFYKKLTDKCKALAKKVTDYKSKRFKIISALTSLASLLAVIISVGVSIRGNAVLICIFPLAAIIFPKAVITFPADNDGLPKGSAARFLMIPFFLAFGGLPFAVLLMVVPVSALILLSAAFAACIAVVFFISDKIDIRDKEGLQFYARICGFRHFLLLAEIKQLEILVEQDPNYYYNILPYCYVLKITKKLKPKFDRIALDGPAWYLGELRETLMF